MSHFSRFSCAVSRPGTGPASRPRRPETRRPPPQRSHGASSRGAQETSSRRCQFQRHEPVGGGGPQRDCAMPRSPVLGGRRKRGADPTGGRSLPRWGGRGRRPVTQASTGKRGMAWPIPPQGAIVVNGPKNLPALGLRRGVLHVGRPLARPQRHGPEGTSFPGVSPASSGTRHRGQQTRTEPTAAPAPASAPRGSVTTASTPLPSTAAEPRGAAVVSLPKRSGANLLRILLSICRVQSEPNKRP